MLVSKKPKGTPGTSRTAVVKLPSGAVSEKAKAEVEEVRQYLQNAVPGADIDEDFLAKVASTWSLSKKNPTVLTSAVKHLQQ
jgi:hypothetical protein